MEFEKKQFLEHTNGIPNIFLPLSMSTVFIIIIIRYTLLSIQNRREGALCGGYSIKCNFSF